MNEINYDSVRAVHWIDGKLRLLDQRLLPHKQEYLWFSDAFTVANAIRDMVVRGAPAIGVTAAYGIVLAAAQCFENSPATWKVDIEKSMSALADSRPTAVNLFWALDRMRKIIINYSSEQPVERLLAEATAIHVEDIAANRCMGQLGAKLISERCAVLTHCNTGSLATGGFGTALGVIRAAYADGNIAEVYADETRPWLQGARLTAWELVQDQIPVTLIVEGAASYLLSRGDVGWVIVGADRITANGDVANKIGTYNLAVSARFHSVRFMVVAPTSTIDMTLIEGQNIPIETRPAEEILSHGQTPVAATGALAWNPAFDVTPAHLIDAIVTEKGVVLRPNREKMIKLMSGL